MLMTNHTHAHRFRVWAALLAFVLSSLVSSASLGSCCCDRALANSHFAQMQAAECQTAIPDATLAPMKECCAAKIHKRSAEPLQSTYGDSLDALLQEHTCACTLSCGFPIPIAYEAVEPRNKSVPELDFFAVSFAPLALVENGSFVTSSEKPLTSLDAQDRCARLCRWLK